MFGEVNKDIRADNVISIHYLYYGSWMHTDTLARASKLQRMDI